MMEEEPDRAPTKSDLERLSVDELRQRIEDLSAEIKACEDELKKKSDSLTTANSLFSTGD